MKQTLVAKLKLHATPEQFKTLRATQLAYKQGSMAIKLDAHYTSQACPMGGHTSPANRPNKGLLFVCQKCH